MLEEALKNLKVISIVISYRKDDKDLTFENFAQEALKKQVKILKSQL